MSMMVSFVLSFFPRDVLDEILKLIESVSEDFPSYSLVLKCLQHSHLLALHLEILGYVPHLLNGLGYFRRIGDFREV